MNIGYAITGSFCTHGQALAAIAGLLAQGHCVTPILSDLAATTDTRFGTAHSLCTALQNLCECPILRTVTDAEPIGPQALFDVLVVAPCTSNTLAKIAHGITDGVVPMAVKSHLRNARPVVLGLASNDALSASAVNWASLLTRRDIYFLPMAQDAPLQKPRSMVADFGQLQDAIAAAIAGQQMQPILCNV